MGKIVLGGSQFSDESVVNVTRCNNLAAAVGQGLTKNVTYGDAEGQVQGGGDGV